MPTSPTADFTFSATYDPATQQVHAHWRGIVPDADLYAHYAELMAIAEAHDNCCYWLLDAQARTNSSPTFGRWMGNEFAPLAHAALGQPLFLAYVVSPAHRAAVGGPAGQAMQHSCAAHSVYSFYFEDMAPAQEWLAHQQAHH
jgi:hypothetical protein